MSDIGSVFTSQLCRTLCDRLNINKVYSTPYYPAGNSIVERTNYSSNLCLYAIARKNRGSWCDFVKSLQAAHNGVRHESLGCSPTYLMFRFDFEFPIVVNLGIPDIPLAKSLEEYKTRFIERVESMRRCYRI